MLIVYSENSNSRSRHALAWLREHEIEFKEVRVNHSPLTASQIKEFLEHTENGLDDLLSHTGKNAELDEYSFDDALKIVVKNPSFIKKPILFNGKVVMSGFNKSDIRVFIPREQRKQHIEF